MYCQNYIKKIKEGEFLSNKNKKHKKYNNYYGIEDKYLNKEVLNFGEVLDIELAKLNKYIRK